jgi:hypothetical protein
MIALICFVLAVLASPFKSNIRLEAENAVLRHQLIVLRRKLKGRARLTNNDRWFFVQIYRWFPSILPVLGEAVTELGSTCGELFLINTSRRTLGVEGEALYQVSSLDSGSRGGPGKSAAVRLFVERSRLADRRFQPTRDDLALIQRICANLEYIPLAIEIAAGHLRRLKMAIVRVGGWTVIGADWRCCRLSRLAQNGRMT